MAYNPQTNTRLRAIHYFTVHEERFPGVAKALHTLFDDPNLDNAKAVMKLYFKEHKQGDIEPLQTVTSAFADKRLVLDIVNSVIDDEDALDYISQRSYPHPIGFDKLVLYHDPDTNFKFRLHIYWRGNQRAAMERLHLHRFEMASAIVTGELTNHTWAVTDFDNQEGTIIPGMTVRDEQGGKETQDMVAYSGYWRDEDGVLHKKHIGPASLERLTSETYVSGQSYAQIVEDAHYVETNAETGVSNGDVCSTIYIHGEGLKDTEGRKIPILFEEQELENPDEIIEPIPQLTKEQLVDSLTRYKSFIEQSLEFYDWLYDEKHGRNLSVGMVAGYLLAERFHNPHVLSIWIEHEKECKEILHECEDTLGKLLDGEITLNDLDTDDRNKRYYALLLHKAQKHPKGVDYWRKNYGDLVREMWRYCGAIKGEKPEVTVLKPIWEKVVGQKMSGGAHYGHISAMVEAAFKTKDMALSGQKQTLEAHYKGDGSPVTEIDTAIENYVREILHNHFPDYGFYGEESGDTAQKPPQEGDRRWVVDPIDGTRNFIAGRDDFCLSMACQKFENGEWITTDGLISAPAKNKVYWAERGQGAYVIDGIDQENQILIGQQPSDVNAPLANKLVDISVKGFGLDGELSLIRSLREQGAVYRATGTAGIMLAQAADTGHDATIITAEEYDVAAGKLIAAEAGAHITDITFHLDGRDFKATLVSKDEATQQALEQEIAKALTGTQPAAKPARGRQP